MTGPNPAPEPRSAGPRLAPLRVEALPEGRGAAVAAVLGAWGQPFAAESVDILAAAGRVFVARDERGRPVGVVAVGEFDGALRLSALAVAPARRRRGVATALLARVVELGRAGMFGAVVAVSPDEPGRALLVKRGFLRVDSDRVSGRHRRLSNGGSIFVRTL